MTPQILTDSPFGRALTEQAKRAHIIVEIGPGGGLGSTQCLVNGMQGDATLDSVEADPNNCLEFVSHWGSQFPRITLHHAVASSGIKPFWHPDGNIQVQAQEMWEAEHKAITTADQVILPERIDLLLLDGGEFTTDSDFLVLGHRSRVIALDDCHPDKSVKNVYPFYLLNRAGWKAIAVNLDDRNGWAIFERP